MKLPLIPMDEFETKNRSRFFTLILIAVAIIGAVGLYQAKQRGLLPNPQGLQIPKPPSQETRTIVQEENAVISVVENASPSVVAIGVSRRIINPYDPFSAPRSEDSTIGTGFIVSEGIIVTNKHVVSDPNGRYTVVTNDDKKLDVQKIYRDPVLDLAIVQVDDKSLKPLEMGDSTKLKVGQTAIAIGNALGRFTNTVTTGIVSGLGRAVTAGDPFEGFEKLDDLIQTDAAINPGNSGGPLLNSKAQVIGVNVATTEGAQNIGFAIPIDAVKQLVEDFKTNGTIQRPYLGIRYQFISKELALMNQVPQGAFIQEVVQDSPADKAGVEAGDILTKINGLAVDSENKISETVAKSKVGDKLQLTLYNDDTKKERQITATLEALPNE